MPLNLLNIFYINIYIFLLQFFQRNFIVTILFYCCQMPKPNSCVDRMKLLLSTGTGADVHFLVGQGDKKELLPAHKAILLSASDVFEAMFRFDAKKKTRDETAPSSESDYSVEVTDVTVSAFKAMLGFIYGEDLSGVNGDNLVDVLCAAKKYDIPGLAKACNEFRITELSNVFDMLAQARFLDEHVLANHCLDEIDKNGDKFIQSEHFLRIDQQLLCEILGRDQLEIGLEVSIWEAAIRWADEQCHQKGIECSGENRRKMLGPALYKIRFPRISREEFTKCIVSSGVLTMEEMVGVYQYHLHPKLSGVPGLYPLRFPTRERVSDRSEGSLVWDIERFSKFANEKVESYRCSDAFVYIKRLPWKILAQVKAKKDKKPQKCLGFFLLNASPKGAKSWSCTCSVTLRIVSQKEGTMDMGRKFEQTFCSGDGSLNWGYSEFVTFTELMDPSKGLYSKAKDKVTLAIDVQADKS